MTLPRTWMVRLFEFMPEQPPGTDMEALYLSWAEALSPIPREQLTIGVAHLKVRKESGTMKELPTTTQFISWCNPIHLMEKTPPRRSKYVHACADLRWAHKVLERVGDKHNPPPSIAIQWAKEVLE